MTDRWTHFSLLKTMKSLWTFSRRCCSCPFCSRNNHSNLVKNLHTCTHSATTWPP